MKPIEIHCNNDMITDFLTLMCKVKSLEYVVIKDSSIKLPRSYNGPAIVDDKVTVFYFSLIVPYLEKRSCEPVLIPQDIISGVQSQLLVLDLMSNPQNSLDTLDTALKLRKPYAFKRANIVDIALAVLSKDEEYKQILVEQKHHAEIS